jgi:hypothetical protein
VTPAAVTEVRIDDLGAPRLNPAQQSVIEYTAGLDVSLAEDDLVARARSVAHLDDFGSDDFRPRLRAHLAAIVGDTGLNNLSRLTLQRRVVRLLASRLALTELLRVHPEIREIEIVRPLIVVGLPRSGTTHLVNLLAADRRSRWSVTDRASMASIPATAGARRSTRCRRRWLR